MTNLFVRVMRDGSWQNIELDQLTDEELDWFVNTQPQAQGWPWVKTLAKWIRDNVKETK